MGGKILISIVFLVRLASFNFQIEVMKKQQHSTNSKDSAGKKASTKVPEIDKMAGSVVKKYDDLIRCTNVLTEGIENGKLFNHLGF